MYLKNTKRHFLKFFFIHRYIFNINLNFDDKTYIDLIFFIKIFLKNLYFQFNFDATRI